MKLRIGNVELENNVTLAPMAGVTDLPFRLLCREQGCGLMCTEMVSAKALLYNNRNTKPILAVREEERPVAVQLFGSDPDIMSDMALRLEEGLSGPEDCKQWRRLGSDEKSGAGRGNPDLDG